jgi:hypothetical protein
MTTKDDILKVLDQFETAGDPGYAQRLLARANVLALLAVADAINRQGKKLDLIESHLESVAAVMEKIAGEHGIITTQNADSFRKA